MPIAISKNFYIKQNPFAGIKNSISEDKVFRKEEQEYSIKDLDTKILIFEDRVKEWFLEIGEELKKNNEAGYIILMICMQYIENIIQLKKGEDSSGKAGQFFKEGLKDLFPNLRQDLVDLTWSSIRCGLFHNGMTGDGIFLNADEGNQLEIALFKINNEDKVLINPHKFLDKVKFHFQEYINKLKDNKNTELRDNFEKMFV